VIAIRNDIDPEVVITWHRSRLTLRDVSTSLDMTVKKANGRVSHEARPL